MSTRSALRGSVESRNRHNTQTNDSAYDKLSHALHQPCHRWVKTWKTPKFGKVQVFKWVKDENQEYEKDEYDVLEHPVEDIVEVDRTAEEASAETSATIIMQHTENETIEASKQQLEEAADSIMEDSQMDVNDSEARTEDQESVAARSSIVSEENTKQHERLQKHHDHVGIKDEYPLACTDSNTPAADPEETSNISKIETTDDRLTSTDQDSAFLNSTVETDISSTQINSFAEDSESKVSSTVGMEDFLPQELKDSTYSGEAEESAYLVQAQERFPSGEVSEIPAFGDNNEIGVGFGNEDDSENQTVLLEASSLEQTTNDTGDSDMFEAPNEMLLDVNQTAPFPKNE